MHCLFLFGVPGYHQPGIINSSVCNIPFHYYNIVFNRSFVQLWYPINTEPNTRTKTYSFHVVIFGSFTQNAYIALQR